MRFTNFICYRGNTMGEMLGGILHSEVGGLKDVYGKTYFSPLQKTTGSFLNDIPSLLLDQCNVFIIMLTKGFFDDFADEETGKINDTSITRKEIQTALKNPRMKFIPVIFKGFSWDEKTKKRFESTVEGDHSKIETALPIFYSEQHRESVLSALKELLKNNADSSPIPQIMQTAVKKQRGKPIIIDGIHIDLIGATKKQLESNYHLQLCRAEMNVYIDGESFKIKYVYEGSVLKKRKDGISGVFMNIVTPSSDPKDTRFAYGYDLISDPQRTQKIPFNATAGLDSMARKMYLPLKQSKKGEHFCVEIHSENRHAITPSRGVSKFLFRLPFKKKPLSNGIIKNYCFSMYFSERPSWIRCTRVYNSGKTNYEGALLPAEPICDENGYYVFTEPFDPAPVGAVRVYTFERP